VVLREPPVIDHPNATAPNGGEQSGVVAPRWGALLFGFRFRGFGEYAFTPGYHLRPRWGHFLMILSNEFQQYK